MNAKPALLVALVATALAVPSTATAAPGGWTQDQVNQAIQKGVTYMGGHQNADGSFGTSYPEAETALALISYGVLDGGDTSKLNATEHDQLTKGVDWLLGHQAANGSWGGFLGSYSTGLALLALSYVGDLQSPTRDIAGAIAKGRTWLILTQNAPPSVTGNTANNTVPGVPGPSPDCTTDASQYPGNFSPVYCGGWDYSPSYSRSDQSNTGFALTGLAATGGVPAAAAQVNIGWQRNVQMLASNPFTQFFMRNGSPANDGGASYEPTCCTGDFSSNANDTGSLIFGYAYDGVPANDPGVQAGITFGTHVLDVYELSKDLPGGAGRVMVYHNAASLSAPCVANSASCNWLTAPGEGGYHYSMFALSKGLGHYLPSDLTDPNNFYAKVVDLLLSEQISDGTADDGGWPADMRDDGSPLGASAFAIMSLGRVGQPAIASGTVFNDTNGNGKRDAGEPGLPGWVVYVDGNGNGRRDDGEPSATTGADGTYTIQGIPEGKAGVRIVPQAGFTCTAPANCAFADLSFKLGDNKTGLDFGQRKPPVVTPQGPVVTPTTKKCLSRRSFTITVRRYKRYNIVKVRITVNGKRVKVVRRHGRFKARVNLRTLTKGRYVVRITAVTKDGKVLRGTRRYRTCTKRRPHTTPPL